MTGMQLNVATLLGSRQPMTPHMDLQGLPKPAIIFRSALIYALLLTTVAVAML